MRGEGNHKIPGSFAPENMEKTGAERVKYSLACQYEDAIPIKFVSYVQKCPTVLCTFAVALRKESVDRNMCFWLSGRLSMVALRKESVDRNLYLLWQFGRAFWSLSARRAWIEIIKCAVRRIKVWSLSARRAWIEISHFMPSIGTFRRSLSARRAWIEIWSAVLTELLILCRSPQGERG